MATSMGITIEDLNKWADCERTRRILPELLRRLVHETTPNLYCATFPTGDPARHKGFDGITGSKRGTGWVPEGATSWEMSTQVDITRKANADLKARKKMSPEYKALNTFMFVTPRSWDGKQEWIDTNREGTGWKDVRALDANDLLDWLEEAWIAEVWLAEQIRQNHGEFETPDGWWRHWADATNPSIPIDLVLARYGNPDSQLLQMLSDPRTNTITISGESRQESIAFVAATLLRGECWDILDRMVILSNPPQSLPPRTEVERILIVGKDERGSPQVDTSGHLVIHPVHHGQPSLRASISLSYIPSRSFYKALEDKKFALDAAWRKTHDAGCSLMVFRRLHAREEATKWPAWTRNIEEGGTLVALLLAGSWNAAGWTDLDAMAELAGVTKMELCQTLEQVLEFEDSPIVRYGDVYIVVSQVEALQLLQDKLTKEILDQFYSMALHVLGERDLTQDIEGRRQYSATVLGESRNISGELAEGLGNSLRLLTIFGNSICGIELGNDLPRRNRQLVQTLMMECTMDEWYSIHSFLKLLAECDPHTFLECLEAELLADEPNIQCIIGHSENSGSGDCMRCDLLWALEALAEDADHYKRAAQILSQLVLLEPDDNYGHKARYSLRAMFHPERLAAGISANLMMVTLSGLIGSNRLAAIDVCLMVMSGKVNRHRLTRSQFRWRQPNASSGDVSFPAGDNEEMSRAENQVRRFMDQTFWTIDRLTSSELRRIVKDYRHLPVEGQRHMVQQAALWRESVPDTECAFMWDYVENTIAHFHPRNDQTRPIISRLRQISAATRPSELANRHWWLFKDNFIHHRRLSTSTNRTETSCANEDRVLLELRKAAINDIIQDGGIDALLNFISRVNMPGDVGVIIIHMSQLSVTRADIVQRALQSLNQKCVELFLRGMFCTDEGLLMLLGWTNTGEIDRDQIRQLAPLLPGTSAAWKVVENCGAEVANVYWKTVKVHSARRTDAELHYCIDKLIEADRPAHAAFVGKRNVRRMSAALWVEILSKSVEQTARRSDGERLALDDHEITTVFVWLDESKEVDESTIGDLEIAFLTELTNQADRDVTKRRDLVLHCIMARDPMFFVSVVKTAVNGKANGEGDPITDNFGVDQGKAQWMSAWLLLKKWRVLPGARSDGRIDFAHLVRWHRETLRRAEQEGVVDHVDYELGKLYAECVLEAKIALHHLWVLEFIEVELSAEALDSFAATLHSGPEFEFREIFVGGAPEQAEIKSIEKNVEILKQKYPKLARSLEKATEYVERKSLMYDIARSLFERRHS